MSSAEKQYFALMRSALWDAEVDVEGDIDWNGVIKIAKHHATLVLLCGAASKMTAPNGASEVLRGKMQVEMRNNLLRFLRLKQIMVSATTLLREHGIEPVILKGFSLALLYPNPYLRQFGDVDIFVGRDNFRQACALLRTLPGAYNWGEEAETGHQYNIEFGNYPMEVHRVSADVVDSKESELYDAIEHDGLMEHSRQVDFEGFSIIIPSNEFMVFYTFFHAWHHFINSGVGWRQVADVAMTLHAYHDQLDLEKLCQWINAMHLMQPWQAFGCLMVEHLGLPKDEMPFYGSTRRQTVQRLYGLVMETGNFSRNNRFKSRRPKNRLMRKMHAFLSIFVDFFYRARVFPTVAFREMRASFKEAFSKNVR